jgi:prepilin-type N-terminal cleavage/methylation domain-containing protein
VDISGAVLKFVPVEAGSRSLRDYLPVAGFSLLELMVVLAVMAVLAVMTLPALMGSSSERTLCREAEELSARLYRFRDLAMEQGVPGGRFQSGRKTCQASATRRRSPEGPGEPGLGPSVLAGAPASVPMQDQAPTTRPFLGRGQFPG